MTRNDSSGIRSIHSLFVTRKIGDTIVESDDMQDEHVFNHVRP